MSCDKGGMRKKQSDAMEENDRSRDSNGEDVKQTITHIKGVGRELGTSVGQEESTAIGARHRKG